MNTNELKVIAVGGIAVIALLAAGEYSIVPAIITAGAMCLTARWLLRAKEAQEARARTEREAFLAKLNDPEWVAAYAIEFLEAGGRATTSRLPYYPKQ